VHALENDAMNANEKVYAHATCRFIDAHAAKEREFVG